ncbi:ISPg3, transposase family protein [Leptospira noguchii serovar Autumnalis str. ZUN142]|uniref:ISPg3, transposase family protein n=1 Tax=Leptospira noguchii serovar Autumnalis str. ZUN142 TaxID=1085540 RepID=M6U5T0_9LEPT|nr:ISPg3, transposase family protein [Leptospira noguchii serovar Autumnalis str. ZUN142]
MIEIKVIFHLLKIFRNFSEIEVHSNLFLKVFMKGDSTHYKIKKDMKNKLMPLVDKILLRKELSLNRLMMNLKILPNSTYETSEFFQLGC